MDVDAILKAALFTPGAKGRWGLPVIFIGPPGSSKTQRVETFAKHHGLHAEVLIGSIREPTDIGGLARLEDNHFRLMPPVWAKTLGEKKHGVVVLDELNCNVAAMQAAMLRLATDGAVGEYMLPPTIRIIAMMNRVEEAAGGWDLSPPLANRFGHLNWDVPSVADWSSWLLSGAEEPETKQTAADIEACVMEEWDAHFAKAKGVVTSFLRAKPGLLHKMPPPNSPDAGKAFPTPRSWEMATRAMAGGTLHKLALGDAQLFVAGFIGLGAASELFSFMKKLDLPNPSDILDGTVVFKHNPKRPDVTLAVLSSCAALVVPATAPQRAQRAEVLWDITNKVADDAADISVQAAMALVQCGLIVGKPALEAMTKLQPILLAAGFSRNALLPKMSTFAKTL